MISQQQVKTAGQIETSDTIPPQKNNKQQLNASQKNKKQKQANISNKQNNKLQNGDEHMLQKPKRTINQLDANQEKSQTSQLLPKKSNQNLNQTNNNNNQPFQQQQLSKVKNSENADDDQTPQQREQLSKLFGVTAIVFEIGVLLGYALSSSFFIQSNQQWRIQRFVVQLMIGFFTIFGYGMLLSIYKYGNWLGFASSIIAVSVSLQFGPVMQNLFFMIFIKNFAKNNPSTSMHQNLHQFWIHFEKDNQISLYSYRMSFLTCVSFLTMMTAVIGRVTIRQLFTSCIIFTIFWNFNFFLLILFCGVKDQNGHPIVFDSYGTSYIYLFAAFFGMPYTKLLKKTAFKSTSQRNCSTQFSLFLSIIGTVCIFCTLLFTYNQLIDIRKNYFQTNCSFFSILFGLVSGVVGTFIGSCISRHGFIGYKEVLVGTISGGVCIGSCARYVGKPWIAIIVGTIAGIIAGLGFKKVQKKLNQIYVYDCLGLFWPFLTSAILGSVIIPPIALKAHQNTEIQGITISSGMIIKQLLYPGITVCLAAIGGCLAGLLGRTQKDTFGMGASARFFLNDFGLFNPPQSDNLYFKSTKDILQDKGQSSKGSQKDKKSNLAKSQKSQKNQRGQKSQNAEDEQNMNRNKKTMRRILEQQQQQQQQQKQNPQKQPNTKSQLSIQIQNERNKPQKKQQSLLQLHSQSKIQQQQQVKPQPQQQLKLNLQRQPQHQQQAQSQSLHLQLSNITVPKSSSVLNSSTARSFNVSNNSKEIKDLVNSSNFASSKFIDSGGANEKILKNQTSIMMSKNLNNSNNSGNINKLKYQSSHPNESSKALFNQALDNL